MVWIARSDKDKQGYGKRSADTEAKRAILSLVTEEDRDMLATEGKLGKMKVRLINEAKQQGTVLTLADLSAIMLLNRSTLSVRTKKYQKDTGKLLPTAGNTLDIGPGITHKRRCGRIIREGLQSNRNSEENQSQSEQCGDIHRRYGTSEDIGF